MIAMSPASVRRPATTSSNVEGSPSWYVGGAGDQERGDPLDPVAETLGERRPQRPVGEAAREDGLLARPAFPPEERTRDLARGVHPFLDVDRQREEVDPLAGLARDDRRQNGRITHLHHDGAVG